MLHVFDFEGDLIARESAWLDIASLTQPARVAGAAPCFDGPRFATPTESGGAGAVAVAPRPRVV
jgi:hypothetical protein